MIKDMTYLYWDKVSDQLCLNDAREFLDQNRFASCFVVVSSVLAVAICRSKLKKTALEEEGYTVAESGEAQTQTSKITSKIVV